jgi:hypothetical protein
MPMGYTATPPKPDNPMGSHEDFDDPHATPKFVWSLGIIIPPLWETTPIKKRPDSGKPGNISYLSLYIYNYIIYNYIIYIIDNILVVPIPHQVASHQQSHSIRQDHRSLKVSVKHLAKLSACPSDPICGNGNSSRNSRSKHPPILEMGILPIDSSIS